MVLRGIARKDYKTKHLVQRIKPGDIAIIQHQDLDEIAALGLKQAKVKAVINTAAFISGKYPNLGPQILVEAGILLLDNLPTELMEQIQEGTPIQVTEQGEVFAQGILLAKGQNLTRQEVAKRMAATKQNLSIILESFVQNTLEYAKQEQELLLGDLPIPEIATTFRDRHTLIVVRGKNYREDLQAIKSYINEVKPVLVGVDGGADALNEFGFSPDLIIGDMDSVSDRLLSSGAELIVHAYPDGRAPGLARVKALGLPAKLLAAPGTSEDIAMLMAYELGTELIAAVGTHSNMIDFLEKGRKGMASTFLVRLKIGSILVDAKGVSKLYGHKLKLGYLALLVLAALLPLGFLIWLAPSTRHLLRLAYIQFKLILGI